MAYHPAAVAQACRRRNMQTVRPLIRRNPRGERAPNALRFVAIRHVESTPLAFTARGTQIFIEISVAKGMRLDVHRDIQKPGASSGPPVHVAP